MTAAPVMSITDELIAELEAAASYCVTEVIRSHPWSEQDFDLLRADERYVRAASPELVRALLAERAELKRDAELYRFVRELAWYVDRASYIYKIGIHAPCQTYWSDQFVSVDADDVEAAIIAAIQAAQ